jgi:hypothetical protein
MTLLVLFFVGTSLLMIGLSVSLIRGRIKPNHWYGFRIPLTLNNPGIWYPTNRYAGWLLLIYGLVLLVVSLVLPFMLGGLTEENAMSIYGLCGCGDAGRAGAGRNPQFSLCAQGGARIWSRRQYPSTVKSSAFASGGSGC